jgi:K+-transporting ATPase A subunit
MTAGWLQIAIFVTIVGLLTRPLGGYLARVYAGEQQTGPERSHLNMVLSGRRPLSPISALFMRLSCGGPLERLAPQMTKRPNWSRPLPGR